MKTITQILISDKTFAAGLAFIAISFLIFLLPDFHIVASTEGAHFSIFLINYLLSIGYFAVLWFSKKLRFRTRGIVPNLEYGFLHLILCLISAYSLNREFEVFEKSVFWMQAVLVIQSVGLILSFFNKQLPRLAVMALFLLQGIGFSLFLYLSVYLIPLYPVGLVGVFILGISFHAFIPLLIAFTQLIYLFRDDNRNTTNVSAFFSGVLISVLVILLFLIQWSSSSQIISRAGDRSLLDESVDLPEWVTIAQKLPKTSISERILKSGIVYSSAPEKSSWRLFEMPGRNFGEARKHDPLVMLATFVHGRTKLAVDDKIRILESMYDARHHAQERLWSGDELQTSHVVTNVRIYPNLRLAYTEKILTVRNTLPKNSWNRMQEAIYTFQLPEGAAITSLSLWVNGKEEKGILTTKQKADNAYRAIVGREARDPSLVRWQEGNTVSVRVFPCSPDEDRRFKIGVTSPLPVTGSGLHFRNITFTGPACIKTDESIKIMLMDDVSNLQLPSGFNKLKQNISFYEGSYKPDWEIRMDSMPVLPNNFSFAGASYKIEEYRKDYENAQLDTVYLDINSTWSHQEFSTILEACKSKTVYVYSGKLLKISPQNQNDIFDELSNLNFSLFPFHEIRSTKNSLVITKGTQASPNLSDLSGSEFAHKLSAWFEKSNKPRLFNLGIDKSPYIKTLKELRAFVYDEGNSSDLIRLLSENKFVIHPEDSNTVAIWDASLIIVRTEGTSVNTAPDHLMRLFAYNHVMAQAGTRYLDKDFYDATITGDAYKAWVVSPFTSLVVLETQADYKRFGISDEDTSLKNASMKSAGAVPEPHEWILIMVVAVFVIILYIKIK